MGDTVKRFARACCLAAIAFCLVFPTGCYSNSSGSTSKEKAPKTEVPAAPAPDADSKAPDRYDPEDYSIPDPEPEYEDPLWPTTNSQLLAIPESERWYNAAQHVGTTCTVAGPVVNVYQAKESRGMPIFVDIGEAYPSSRSVTLLIWAEALSDFEEMLNEVDDGDAWISVTGYLGTYEGRLQFNIDDGPVQYTWWTHVS